MPQESVFVPTRVPRWGFHVLAGLLEFVFFIFARVKVTGRENFPTAGGYICVINHLSIFDVALSYVILKGDRVSRGVAFAGDTWRQKALTRFALQLANVIWVHRGETAPSTIKASIRALREGYILGVAPEGTRSRVSHALIKGRTGAAFLGIKANVPLVPIAIWNIENLSAAMKRLKRIEINARVGKPFVLNPLPGGQVNQDYLEQCTNEIMCHIAALLPLEYQGVYSDHPRLKELLEEQKTHSS